MRHVGAAMVAVVAATAVAADRPPPPVLAPLGPWVVEAERDTCLVQRSYGSREQRVMVAFQPVFDLDSMEVIVLTPQPHPDQRSGDATLVPGPDGAKVDGIYFSLAVNEKPERFTRITTVRTLLDALGTAETLAIRAKPVDIRIRLVGFARAMRTFEACKQDLLRSWGVDPAAVTPERAPRPRNLLRFFGPENYPVEAQRSGLIGRVVAVVQVDATGKATACRVAASAGQILNAGTCRQAMKVPFDAGTDAAGRPVPSIYVLAVRWIMGSG